MSGMQIIKKCIKCKKTKKLDEFYKKYRSKTKYMNMCKECVQLKRKQQQENKLSKKKCECCGKTLQLQEYDINNAQSNKYKDICKQCFKDMQTMKLKKCDKCRKEKPVNQYYECRITEDKLFKDCKPCCNTYWGRNYRDEIEQTERYINNPLFGRGI